MASIKIYNKPNGLTSKLNDKDYANSKIKNVSFNTKINDEQPITKSIKEVKHTAKIKNISNGVRINEVLHFRVKFTNIQIPGYGPNNVPPIGIAIVGINNYIL